MGKILKAVVLAWLFPAVLMAGGATGAEILKVETGGRATGMGGAYAALGTDADSMAYNPAGIASVTMREIGLGHMWSFASTQIEKISYAQPLETAFIEGNVGLYAIYRHIPTIANADATDAPVDYYDGLIKAAYASNLGKLNLVDWGIAKNLNVGAAVCMVIEQMSGTLVNYNGSTLALDLGAQYDISPGFRAGAAIDNIGLNITYNGSEGASPVPVIARAGLSYAFDLDKTNKMTTAFEYIQNIYDYPRVAFGIEDMLMNIVSLRFGYNTSMDTRNAAYISAGAGIQLSQPGLLTVIFDYTYRPVLWGSLSNLEQTHILSLQVRI
jgi:hypothetical protein